MKVVAFLIASLTAVAAFAPAQNGRSETSLAAAPKKAKFFAQVFGMDLFAPVATQNDYGARGKKNLKVGKIGSNSYVPEGLSATQYARIRKSDQSKKDKNYKKNVAKAGKYIDFTKWYLDRGTDITDKWVKTVSRGHTFAKTKYDFSGKQKDEQKNYDGSA